MGEIGELVVADERIKNCAVPANTGNFVCATRGCSFLRLNFFSIQIPEIETFLAAMACGCVCARMARAEISGRVSIARRVELVRANRTRTGWKVCGRRALREVADVPPAQDRLEIVAKKNDARAARTGRMDGVSCSLLR